MGEFLTGRGTLQQIGLLTPNPALFYSMLAGFGGLISYNAARSIYRATNKKMTAAYALTLHPTNYQSVILTVLKGVTHPPGVVMLGFWWLWLLSWRLMLPSGPTSSME